METGNFSHIALFFFLSLKNVNTQRSHSVAHNFFETPAAAITTGFMHVRVGDCQLAKQQARQMMT
jgi:hypothetical protein